MEVNSPCHNARWRMCCWTACYTEYAAVRSINYSVMSVPISTSEDLCDRLIDYRVNKSSAVFYTLSQKNKTPYSCWQLREILLNFNNSFNCWTQHTFATKRSLQIPPHLQVMAAVPCETVIFQLLASSGANTLLKRNVKLGQCFPFPSLSSAVYQARLLSSFS